jgi:putative oligomerization/nucleic acid binding protein
MGLLRGMARTAVVAGTATAVSNRVSRRQAARWAAEDQTAYVQQPPAQDDLTEKLDRLTDMKESGQLTDEEFAAAKARLLDL